MGDPICMYMAVLLHLFVLVTRIIIVKLLQTWLSIHYICIRERLYILCVQWLVRIEQFDWSVTGSLSYL